MALGNNPDPNDPANNPGPPPNPPDPANPNNNEEVNVKRDKTILIVMVIGFSIIVLLLYFLISRPTVTAGQGDLKPVVQTQEQMVNTLKDISQGLTNLPEKFPKPMTCEDIKKCTTPTPPQPQPTGHTHYRRPGPGPVVVTQPSDRTNNVEVTVTVDCGNGGCGQSAPPEHHEHTNPPEPGHQGHEGPVASEADNDVIVVPQTIRIDH